MNRKDAKDESRKEIQRSESIGFFLVLCVLCALCVFAVQIGLSIQEVRV